jgi:hypothetical protein
MKCTSCVYPLHEVKEGKWKGLWTCDTPRCPGNIDGVSDPHRIRDPWWVIGLSVVLGRWMKGL